MAAESITLHVGAGAGAGPMKVLLAAAASGSASAVTAVPASSALPMGASVALQVGARFLGGANSACRFIAAASGMLNAGSLAVDSWVEWEATALAPLVTTVVAAAADGVAFPVTTETLRAQFAAGDEKLPALHAKGAVACGSEASVAGAVAAQRLGAALAKLEGAASGSFLVGDSLSLADVVVASTAEALFAANVFAADAFPASRAYVATVMGTPEAVAAKAAVAALAKSMSVDPVEGANIKVWLEKVFLSHVHSVFPALKEAGFDKVIVTTAGGKFTHHYQFNSMMRITSVLKIPRDEVLATTQRLINSFPSNTVIAKMEAAGRAPMCFINITLSNEYLQSRVAAVINRGLSASPLEKKLNILIDYSSPNIAKEMHVGHLRSTIIGDTLSRILEFAGHNVTRVNHVGDWGTQFGMLIAHLKDMQADGGESSIADLSRFYKQAKERFDAEPEFKARAKLEVVKLQGGDEENLRLWKGICAVSESMFTKVYKRLGIDPRLKVVGESFYNPMLPGVIKALEGKGMVQESDGARVIFVEESKTPLMLVKSDGGVGYDSTDLAAIRYRTQKLKQDWLIYVVDSGQSLHFNLVFAAAKKAGWTEGTRVDHVGFGVVQSKDPETGKKKKFSSRAGKSVRLVDVLDEARDLCKAELEKRAAEGGAVTESKEIEKTAEALGYGGVKYFDLRQNRLSNYVFSYERMLARNGDTAVYMQYSHARIASIVRKAGVDASTLNAGMLDLKHPAELEMAFEIARFGEVVDAIHGDLMPHRLTEYLYGIATKFSDFYQKCKVVGSPDQDSRLALCHAVAVVVRTCMELLGISPCDRL